mgnify:FL=1
MPRKKKKATPKKKPIIRNMVEPDAISIGDVCYFVGGDNSIRMGEVLQLFLEDNTGPAIQVRCVVNGSCHAVPVRLTAWDHKSLKGKKWDIKADLTRYDDNESR